MIKRKARKRKRIQHGGMMEYGTVASYIATKVSITPQLSKKAYSSSSQEKA